MPSIHIQMTGVYNIGWLLLKPFKMIGCLRELGLTHVELDHDLFKVTVRHPIDITYSFLV